MQSLSSIMQARISASGGKERRLSWEKLATMLLLLASEYPVISMKSRVSAYSSGGVNGLETTFVRSMPMMVLLKMRRRCWLGVAKTLTSSSGLMSYHRRRPLHTSTILGIATTAFSRPTISACLSSIFSYGVLLRSTGEMPRWCRSSSIALANESASVNETSAFLSRSSEH